jgi:hypothetical protein
VLINIFFYCPVENKEQPELTHLVYVSILNKVFLRIALKTKYCNLERFGMDHVSHLHLTLPHTKATERVHIITVRVHIITVYGKKQVKKTY